jgi:hypothetical protein
MTDAGADTDHQHPVTTGAAWRSFCERLAAVGERLLDDGFPSDPRDRAEGYRHLANQVACWLTYGIGHTDPARPAFFRSSDPVYAWGGPNVDQVARRALIDGAGTYRVTGAMGACEEWVLQVKAGAVQSGGADVVAEVYASDLGLGPGDRFDLVLGGDPRPGHWFPLDAAATFVHVRDYYFAWRAAEPATFVIERLDDAGPTARTATPEAVGALLDDAARTVEHSIGFWRDYQVRMRAQQDLNRFGAPGGAARGVQDIAYSHGFVALPPDQVLVLEIRAADAALWDVMLYNRAWYEPLDHVGRTTSRNHRQVHVDPDGLVRVVLAAEDPGVPNWLDTEGRAEVLGTVRWLRPPATPHVDAHLVPTADLRGHLPGGHPAVTAADRRAEVAARIRHAGWRYRT